MARRNLLKGFKKPKGRTFEIAELKKDYGKLSLLLLNQVLVQLLAILYAGCFYHRFRVMRLRQFESFRTMPKERRIIYPANLN